MDDLDHSMHIAEYDWTSFYEESEECCFRQPSLACPDNLSLSDSEDSGNAGRQHNTAANWNESESVAEGCCAEEAQTNPEREDEEDREVWTSSETSLRNPEGNTINIKDGLAGFADPVTVERTERDDDTTATRHEQLNVQPSDGEPTELQKEDGDVQTQSDTGTLDSLQEHDPLSCNQTALHANAPNAVCRPGSEDVGSVSEKERWFVTVNDNPARQRSRAPSGKKKRRQKKPRKNNQTSWAPVQEKPDESSLELEKRKDTSGSEGGRETSGGYTGAEETPEGEQVSDVSQMSGEEDSLPEKHATSKPSDENTMSDGDKHEPIRSAQETLQPRGPPRLDSVESDEFMSTHSYDSETYLSAAESVEEPLRLLMEDQHLQRTSSLFSLTENTNADESQDRETSLHERALCCDASAANCEGYKSTDVEPALTFPSVGQSAYKMPDDNSTCDRDTHSTPPCIPSEAPPPQNHEINLSASGCSSGDQFSLVPKLTVTPCSVADSPETYAKAAGHPRPVYAISAFWDEMEKLTINDILQLRVGRKTPPGDTRETVTPDVDDLQTNQSSLVDTAEYSSSDGGLMDTSDAADSDYFTQPDESKPDRSSCEFSTSDFEEEYWQFLGASRNPSPDPQSKNQDRTGDSPYFDEEETASSEGKETPVPLEDFVERSFENQDSNAFISAGLLLPGRMMKSKSLHNVHALSTEDSPLQMLLGEDETSVLLSSFSPLEENLVLKASDTLGTLEPASFLSHTQVVGEYDQLLNPEVFRYFLTDNKAERDSRCVSVFDPEDISVAPVFDYTLRAFTEERPIPIFTCSRPTLGELTFPNPDYVFLSADFMDDEDIISPIKVVSRAFVQGNDFGTSAAAGFPSWKSLLLMRKIRFQDKGSIWCGKSGAWVFPLEAEKVSIDRADPPVSVLTESGDTLTPQLFTELAVQQTTRRQGVFSTLKQSDMCLVCIAFASWVLKSSDPKAADTWKAALLANVSALSAIQYLRQYVKRRNPSQDDP